MSSLDTEEFIDSTGTPSVKWGLLLSTLIGSWFLGLWEVVVSYWVNFREAVGGLLLDLGGAVAVFISELFGIPIDGIAAAIVQTANWLGLVPGETDPNIVSEAFGVSIETATDLLAVPNVIDLFGPLAFPIGVAVTFLTIELVRRGVSRVL